MQSTRFQASQAKEPNLNRSPVSLRPQMRPFAAAMVALMAFALVACPPTFAQSHLRPTHPLVRSTMAPGAIAYTRLLGDPSLGQYFQPVEVQVPAGATVNFWNEGGFAETAANTAHAGLTVGPVYRLKIQHAVAGKTVDVYPSIEMVDRLYPPEELVQQHPVRIVIDENDIKQVVRGKMITKVIYLEDPLAALPYRQIDGQFPTLDVSFSEDPYHIASRLGRPMAIVRIGTRQPIAQDLPGEFDFNNPPIQWLETEVGAAGQTDGPDAIQPVTYRQPTSDKARFEWTVSTSGQDGCNECPPVDSGCAPLVQPLDCYECAPTTILTPQPQRRMRDEFICDGDDAAPPVLVNSERNILGLGLEDTIAHFETEAGEAVVVPSNRVCIYAPRFSAVRKVHSFGRAEIAAGARAVREKIDTVEKSGEETTQHADQRLRLQANKLANRAGIFHDQTRNLTVETATHLKGSQATFGAYSNLHLIKFGRHSNSETTRLRAGLQSALAWDDNVASQMTVKNAQAIIVDDVAKLQEIVGVKSDFHPVLRLVKVASRISARPGDSIEFTIRFDNVGNQRIQNVTIADNLSPRLEYIPDSASCTLDADLKVTSNAAGSVSLEWTITEPMEKGEGGVIQFECRVR